MAVSKEKQINPEYMDCWSYTINHIPPFIFKDTRVISNQYTLDGDPCSVKYETDG